MSAAGIPGLQAGEDVKTVTPRPAQTIVDLGVDKRLDV
jgi:hypothetical protein